MLFLTWVVHLKSLELLSFWFVSLRYSSSKMTLLHGVNTSLRSKLNLSKRAQHANIVTNFTIQTVFI
jgi:hypothetical protein